MSAHPLDPLSADEIRRVAAILRRDRGVTERWRFASIELREPSKQAVRDLAAERRAVVICWNRDDGQVYKATVSLTADAVEAWDHQPDGQPNMTVDEFVECDAALRKDPRVIAALAERGITDMDSVLIDTWAYGAHLVPEQHRGGRVGWADVWYRKVPGASPYANPVTGLHSDAAEKARHMAEQLYAPWQGRAVPDSYKVAVSAVQQERAGKTFQDHMQSGAFAMGTPDTVIKVLKKYQEAGVDQILCFMQMGNLAHARIMDSIKLFGRYVIPYFK